MWGLGLRTCLRGLLAAGCAAIAGGVVIARADTLEWALVQAYQNNPSLNAQRAALRATDENVPQALSGYRPKLSVTASGGWNFFDQVNARRNPPCLILGEQFGCGASAGLIFYLTGSSENH